VNHLIDIIIPNYNGAALLPACLDALAAQTRRDWRILIVDDASTDDSLAVVRQRYPDIAVLALPRNGGFVRTVNAGIAQTSAPLVILLNNDTVPDARFVEHLAGALERFPAYAFAAAKLRLFDRADHLHSAGDGYGWDGVPFSRGVWQPDQGQFDVMCEVFGPCAGAAIYRRTALTALASPAGEVLDANLIFYCEDVDLNLRARRAGLRTIFVPQAVVLHHLSATGGGVLASYYCGRNFFIIWAKNLPTAVLLRSLPHFLKAQLAISLAALRHIRGAAARARLRGQWAGLRALPQTWRRRRFGPQEAANLTRWIGK
jgi:GT2 family glycosyltransferase